MQLDKTNMVIRERGLLEILDLALHLIRAHAMHLLAAFCLGVLPFALLNAWLLNFPSYYEAEDWYLLYTFWTLALVLLEMPIAGALTTLYLGQTLFLAKPDWRALHRDFWKSLPQLLLYQGVIRTILLMPVITSFLPYASWAYLSEIILLERNPLRAKRDGISTWRRSKLLHGSNVGDIFVRWIGIAMIAALQVMGMMIALFIVKVWLTSLPDLGRLHYAIFLNLAVWSTAFFATVARFLCYLDLRIRREGWEVELRMRAEAVRMAGALS
ncbi:MAG: hypothetical protein WEA31_07140 [Pirellulales bacterium]